MTKKINYKAFLALFFSFHLFACAASNSSSSSKEIYPIKVGNTFISKKEYFDFKTGVHYLTKMDTVKIVGTQIINEETFYRTNTNQYIIERPTGYWTDKGKTLEAKYPGAIGDTFFSYFKITNEKPPDTVNGIWKIIAKDARITVPAGTFTCWEYRRETIGKSGRLHLRNFAWFSPGYGMIKREDYYPGENGSLILVGREELVSEELN